MRYLFQTKNTLARSTQAFSKASMFTLLILYCASSSADIAIIIHPDNPIRDLSHSRIQYIFQGKVKAFPNGKIIQTIGQKDNSEIQNLFTHYVLNKTNAQNYSYWARMLFTGRAKPPREAKGGDAEVIKIISEQRNAIGYINSKSVTKQVKVLYIFKIPPSKSTHKKGRK